MSPITLRIRQLNEDMFSHSRNQYMLYAANNILPLKERIEYHLLSQKEMHFYEKRLLHTN